MFGAEEPGPGSSYDGSGYYVHGEAEKSGVAVGAILYGVFSEGNVKSEDCSKGTSRKWVFYRGISWGKNV